MLRCRFLFMTLLLVVISAADIAVAEDAVLAVGRFSADDISGWEGKRFSGDTRYRLVQLHNRSVLKADSRNSASAFVKTISIDLQQYPYLNWQWRIDHYLDTGDERLKENDDYSARIYLIVDGKYFVWNTRALAYVWSNDRSAGDVWPNAYVGDHAMMLSVRDRSDSTNTWYSEKRNVYDEMKRLFGEDVRHIDAVAIMTDSDDSGGSAAAYFGDIYFSRQ